MKRQTACWKVFVCDSKFQTFLLALGACGKLSQEIAGEWKNLYAAYMAFEKRTYIVRYEKFTKKKKRGKKVVDFSVLPPCKSFFLLPHSQSKHSYNDMEKRSSPKCRSSRC